MSIVHRGSLHLRLPANDTLKGPAAATATPMLPPLVPLPAGAEAMTLPPLLLILFLFLFLFLLLHANGVVVSHLFPAADIGVTASSVAAAVVLGAVIPRVETKMAPTKLTVATMNETRHNVPSTLPSDPHPREGKGKVDEGKGGGHHYGRRW
jgi:hypothetical protein